MWGARDLVLELRRRGTPAQGDANGGYHGRREAAGDAGGAPSGPRSPLPYSHSSRACVARPPRPRAGEEELPSVLLALPSNLAPPWRSSCGAGEPAFGRCPCSQEVPPQPVSHNFRWQFRSEAAGAGVDGGEADRDDEEHSAGDLQSRGGGEFLMEIL
jgi:hypothetical protein